MPIKQTPLTMPKSSKVEPIAELLLKLNSPKIQRIDESYRLTATAQLSYQPESATTPVTSSYYTFIAPFGTDELEEIRWYIEEFYRWPTGVFKERAEKTEIAMMEWGQKLYQAALDNDTIDEPLKAWLTNDVLLRFSVQVDVYPPEGDDEDERVTYHTAASQLLSLPWELMHDGSNYLSQSEKSIQVRRRLSGCKQTASLQAKLPIRVLLLSPRPEITEDGIAVDYLEHRSTAIALIQAMEHLGQDLVKVDILSSPTFDVLKQTLKQAKEDNSPFDIIHFDGHGSYDFDEQIGVLCFEHATNDNEIQRVLDFVYADDFASVLQQFSVPLVYLDACQSALTKGDPTASVATSLMTQGVASVVAMSHKVLAETARRFVEPFYKALADGLRVGDAMLVCQAALYGDSNRGKVSGAGGLNLQDWFVPVLYQQADDPLLFNVKSGESMASVVAKQLLLGKLPKPPDHSFVGRSWELLQLERLLQHCNYAVIKGSGGMGKTAIATELVRWLVRCERFDRAVFVNVESHNIQHIQGVIDSIGCQLVPDYTVALYKDTEAALRPIEGVLQDSSTLILVDNMESVLPDHNGNNPTEVTDFTELLELCQQLLSASENGRVIFTSRESLPKPFANSKNTVTLGALHPFEAIELVEQVITRHGWQVPQTDDATTPAQITELVEAVHCHPRALVLLAREVAEGAAKGVRATTANINELMVRLDEQNPGDRENSLYASVELSLRRLPSEVRELVNVLAVFHGGGFLVNLSEVMETDIDDALVISNMLVEVGMAQWMEYSYLRLDPALSAYLRLEQSQEDLFKYTARWAEAMIQLVSYLYQERDKESTMVASLILFEEPNLVALLEWLLARLETDLAEQVSDTAGRIEQLLAEKGQPKALAKAVFVREQAAALTSQWNQVLFEDAYLSVERSLQQNKIQQGFVQAENLLRQAQTADYPGSDYDLAVAYFLFGKVLKKGDQPTSALEYLNMAQCSFKALERQGERMWAVTLTELADCFVAIGQLDNAVEKYHQALEKFEKLKALKDVAVCKGQLADVFRMQGRYADAIKGHEYARAIFEGQNEPGSVAIGWHKLGIIHEQAGQYQRAEAAYRQSLEIYTQQHDLLGQASNLGQLGNLYGDKLVRLEESLLFYRQAADIFGQLQDLRAEGTIRNNTAKILIELKRNAQARQEVLRAIDCESQFECDTKLWSAFDTLYQIEMAEGNFRAAEIAWAQSRDSYFFYRQRGGYAQTGTSEFVDGLIEFINKRGTDAAFLYLSDITKDETKSAWHKTFASHLQNIIQGSTDKSAADDMSLPNDAAAEILFFISHLKR